MLAIAYAYAGL